MLLNLLFQVMRDEEEEKGRRIQAATLAAQTSDLASRP